MQVFSKLKILVRGFGSEALPRFIGAQAWAAAALSAFLFPRQRTEGKKPLNLAQVQRILVVHLFELGDVLWLSPFLRELRRLFPQAEITLIVKPESRNLVETCPYVNEVIAYNARLAPVWRPFILPWRAFWTGWRDLRPRQFDLALVPSLLADNSYASFLACFSGAPWRVGYSENILDRRRRLNRGFDRLFTSTLKTERLQHDLLQNLAVIPFLGGTVEEDSLEVWTDPNDESFAEAFLRERGVLPGETLVALSPTAGHSALKQWPLKSFVRLAHWLSQEKGMRVLVIGGPGEAFGAAFEEGPDAGVINAVGQTTLRQMAALVRHCCCFVGNDAGPTHMAPALGVPTVALFGSSCHHRAGPWGKGHVVISHELSCSPCGQGHIPGADFRCKVCIFDEPRCMTGLTLAEVQSAVEARLPPAIAHKAAAPPDWKNNPSVS